MIKLFLAKIDSADRRYFYVLPGEYDGLLIPPEGDNWEITGLGKVDISAEGKQVFLSSRQNGYALNNLGFLKSGILKGEENHRRGAAHFGQGHKIRINNCRFSEAAWDGFSIVGCTNVKVEGCVAFDNETKGLGIDRSSAVKVIKSSFLRNNVDEDLPIWNKAGTKVWMRCKNIRFIDCAFNENNGPGLWFDRFCKHVKVENSTFTDNTMSGLFLECSPGQFDILRNRFEHNKWGLQFRCADNVNVLGDNVFRGNEAAFALTGSGLCKNDNPDDEYRSFNENYVVKGNHLIDNGKILEVRGVDKYSWQRFLATLDTDIDWEGKP